MQYQWVFGDFLSSKAEQDVFFEKRQATKWDVMSQRSEEQKELIRPHEALGMESSDATMVVNLFAKYKNISVDQRMETNKEMLPADGEVQQWKNGLDLCFIHGVRRCFSALCRRFHTIHRQ
ncbi:uncharacterized protein LOC129290855 isoform X1 [Prosopis cineraria]|uniref:uncharacterized protein LOC129290855 isoform X1 n=1 Tax=Prosopis cineraria TaxID=364024 RepID=UPI00240F2764|nr:uncharacterized protein LOC129290855 isoform X1 [Prosopis cineraria]